MKRPNKEEIVVDILMRATSNVWQELENTTSQTVSIEGKKILRDLARKFDVTSGGRSFSRLSSDFAREKADI